MSEQHMACKEEDEKRGTVKVINGQYKPSGQFHFISPNTPIKDENGKLAGVTNPRDMTYIHSYGGDDIAKSEHITNPKADLSQLCEQYHTTVKTLFDKHAPVRLKSININHLHHGCPLK